ncbi:toll/interleukin-1 receptor domain-containing protein [bacterium]|nr:toll/interleukin-1 receptor domain-containing protein [bacterium]
MRILKVDKAIEKLNSKNLISLKKSQEFIFSKKFYLLLINTAAYHKGDITFFLSLYREAALKFPTSFVTYEKFLEMFGTLCKAIKKDIQDQERPLELLINTYRLFNKQPVEDFINKISKLSLSDKPIFYEGEDKLMVNQEVAKDKTDKNIFISYSRKDLKWLERLQIHLKPIERKGIINRWDDTMIKVGSKWREEIKTAIINADAAILLVSADFLASDFIVNNELPPLLKLAQMKGIKILPFIVSA